MPTARLILGTVEEALPQLAPASFDGCICDPPYGYRFMGAAWDHGVPSAAVWRQVLDALKPGAYLLAFGGPRTHHRLACAIEDAGFELRDVVIWLHGQGFPKTGEAVARGIDQLDAAEERRRRSLIFTTWMRSTGITSRQIAEATGGSSMASHYLTEKEQPEVATAEMFDALRPFLPAVPAEIEDLVAERTVESENMRRRDVVGQRKGKDAVAGDLFAPGTGEYFSKDFDVTAPHTAEAARWAGFSPTLKPAWEPIILAMRPLDGTLADNATAHGVAGLNIGASKIGTDAGGWQGSAAGGRTWNEGNSGLCKDGEARPTVGRWPANVILSHHPRCVLPADEVQEFRRVHQPDHNASRIMEVRQIEPHCHGDCPLARLDAQSSEAGGGFGTRGGRAPGGFLKGLAGNPGVPVGFGDAGGASRFFYCAKASPAERDGSQHPTLKPVDLAAWLAKLLLPPARPGGERRLLVPFSGAGSEVLAAMRAGWESVTGVEMDPKWVDDAARRIAGDAPLLNRVEVEAVSSPQTESTYSSE
jgi:DNA modification methylase